MLVVIRKGFGFLQSNCVHLMIGMGESEVGYKLGSCFQNSEAGQDGFAAAKETLVEMGDCCGTDQIGTSKERT